MTDFNQSAVGAGERLTPVSGARLHKELPPALLGFSGLLSTASHWAECDLHINMSVY